MRTAALALVLAACADVADVADVAVENTNPTLTAPQVAPASPLNDSTLTATVSSGDADGDAVSLVWSWFNQTRGESLGAEAQVRLSSAVASPDDLLVVTVTVTATDARGGEAVATSQIVLGNRAPTVGGATLSPPEPARAGPFTCAAVATDADDDELAYTYVWTVNATPAGSDTATLPGPFQVDDVIACAVTVDDGHGGVVSSAADSVIVANLLPSIGSVTIDPPAPRYVGAALTCTAEVADADGEEVTTTYGWSDTITGEALSAGAVLTLNPAQHPPGRSLTCTATAIDASGGVSQATAVANVDNRAPTVAPSLAPDSPHPGEPVVCNAGALDADGVAPTVIYAWENTTRGTNLGYSPLLRLEPPMAAAGDLLTCTVTAVDAQGLFAVGSASGAVVNADPEVTVALAPASPSVQDTVRCAVDAVDADDDALTIYRVWTLNGGLIGVDTRVVLPDTAAAPGDELVCTATVVDSAGAVVIRSASAVLTDAPITFDTADTAFEPPEPAGFFTTAVFAYDPASDSARGWFEGGQSYPAAFRFIFFDQAFRDGAGALGHTCTLQLGATAPLPRASWAGPGSGYLFGVDFDPYATEILSDCEALFPDFTPLWNVVLIDVWGAAVSTTMDNDLVDAMLDAGRTPTDYLGGDFVSSSLLPGGTTWALYTTSYALQPNFDAGPNEVVIPPAQAHGPATLNRALFFLQSYTSWVFR